MTTVLVLGANGFLGRQVSRAAGSLVFSPHLVGVGRHQPPARPEGIDEWRCVDLAAASADDHLRLYKEVAPDIVINCAGCTAGGADELTAGNVTLVERLVQALSRLGSARLVHLGSAAEYGRQPAGVAIRESAVPDPVSDYGRAKLASTRSLEAAVEAGHLDATVLRVFNPVGSGAPTSSLPGRVSAAIRDALDQGSDAIRLGPLDASRDFVAARDVAVAAVRAALTDGVPAVLNVGSGYATPSRALVDELVTVAGFSGAVIEAESGSARSSAVDWQAADITLLRHHLDWAPAMTLTESLIELWAAS